jgi:hypothetical protein
VSPLRHGDDLRLASRQHDGRHAGAGVTRRCRHVQPVIQDGTAAGRPDRVIGIAVIFGAEREVYNVGVEIIGRLQAPGPGLLGQLAHPVDAEYDSLVGGYPLVTNDLDVHDNGAGRSAGILSQGMPASSHGVSHLRTVAENVGCCRRVGKVGFVDYLTIQRLMRLANAAVQDGYGESCAGERRVEVRA